MESIVKGLAELQLDFNTRLDTISGDLSREIDKLEDIRQAIGIANQQLDEIHQIRIAAEALNILVQENEQKNRAFAEEQQRKTATRETEILETRQAWEKEQNEFDTTQKIRLERLKKQREKNETDYQYDFECKQALDLDKFELQKRTLERKLAEENEARNRNWTEREKLIASRQEELEKYRKLADTFPGQLARAIQEAEKETLKEIKENADLNA